MVGASSRLLFRLTTPVSLLRHRPIALFQLARRHSLTNTLSAGPNLLRLTSSNSLNPVKFSQNFYSRATSYASQENNHPSANGYHAPPSHPWPEWSRLLESLYLAGYSNGNGEIEDEFMANENLSMEFIAAANSCLAFAHDRTDILGWLPRRDIEVLVTDGYPFLFKSAHETEKNEEEGSNEATSVDLMKYILSYASNPVIYPERNIKEATESSVRSLLQEMANLTYRGRPGRASNSYEQMPRNLGLNITMKKGDWICPKCSFMNFARNTKCLECEESRPQRQLVDGEWDCPRCNFFNYRKNAVCLKCECRRPDTPPLHGTNSGYVLSRHTHGTDKEDKTERWFKKVKELHGVTGPESDISHDGFPRMMPPRKVENGFVDNEKKYQPVSPYQRQQVSSFVPFPLDYFAKKDDQKQSKSTESATKPTLDKNLMQETRNPYGINEHKPETAYVGQQIQENPNGKVGWTGKSLEGSAVTEPDPLDMSEEAKQERWFKRVAQIKDISELSQIPDEDFPSIMPMRKGVNRFVVSKRKTPLERRLTSPQYRKNLRIMSSDPMKREGNDDN
ncbi:hypothetical protein L1987_02429 [Smallanthus sonchifolius]|uniref:Uncharacterized protein n=1 Tax=Smallanthus sonchifolius TaxID=185202 RepID=A0ACB9K7S4_9ASTR|nr:hypothetical protein L1987_02429 [Smallanthus sonchifolius]